MLTPEPFYETVVLWKQGVTYGELREALQVVAKYQKKIDPYGFMTDPIFEYNNGFPAFVWAIFFNEGEEIV